MPIVGFLSTLTEDDFGHLLTAFKNGLCNNLHTPKTCVGSGHNVPTSLGANDVFIQTRWTKGVYGPTLKNAAGDLVRSRPAVIAATGGVVSAKAAESKTRTIPIVFLSGRTKNQEHDDHPANTAGIWLGNTKYAVEKLGRHEILKELFEFTRLEIFNLIHKLSIVFDDEKDWTNAIVVTNGIEKGFDKAFDEILKCRARALTISADSFFTTRNKVIVKFANERFNKPVCYPFREYVEHGGLMSYGPNLADAYRSLGLEAAQIINEGLTGKTIGRLKKPAKVELRLVANRATANAQLGSAEAQKLLGAAHDVI